MSNIGARIGVAKLLQSNTPTEILRALAFETYATRKANDRGRLAWHVAGVRRCIAHIGIDDYTTALCLALREHDWDKGITPPPSHPQPWEIE